MRTYFLFFIFALFFFPFVVQSQNFSIQGKVINPTTKLPIESATVYLTRVKDSTVLEYSITDRTGSFLISTKKIEEASQFKVSMVGFNEYSKTFEKLNENIDLGAIVLDKKDTQIEEVIVKTTAPPIRVKNDTLEFNASSFKIRPDANVESLIKQLPGVEVDENGKITVNGKEVNQILVNGKPFFDKDGKVAMQNLPANIINKVQVTDTKTKKEEKTGANASSNNASINLTIDEKKNKGFFGKAMAGYGSDDRYESSGIINYFKNKTKVSLLASANNINSVGFSMDEIFDNMGGGRSGNRLWAQENGSFYYNGQSFGSDKGITESNLVGINYSDEYFKKVDFASSFFHSNTNNSNRNKSHYQNFLPSGTFETFTESITKADTDYNNFNFTSDIKIDSTFSIVFEPKFSINKRKNFNFSKSSSYENNSLLNETTSENYNQSLNKVFENKTTITKSFKKKSRNISLEIENSTNITDDEIKTNSQTNFYQLITPSDIRNQLSNRTNKFENYSANIEYQEPITDSLQITLGSELKYYANKNIGETFDYDNVSNSFFDRNDLLSSVINSKILELKMFTGINFEKKKFNFNIDLGTTSINNTNNSDYLGIQTRLDKHYMLPKISLHSTYKFSKTKNLWIYYDLNYNIPQAFQLLPIQNLSNPLNTISGNPDLNINKTHYTSISYRNYDYTTRSGYGFYAGVNYNENEVVSNTVYDDNRKRNTTYVNISGSNSGWFGLYWNKSIKKEKTTYRYEFRINNNLNYDKGFVNGVQFSSNTISVSPTARFTYEINEKLIVSPSYNFKKEYVSYANYSIDKTSFYTHRFNLQLTSFWPKNWTFGNDFGYNYNSNLGTGFKKDFYLWNTSLAYSFYNNKFLAKVKVYDVLNQNQNTRRTVNETSIYDEENIVLKRYVMFSLTYKIHMFDSKEKKQQGPRYMMYN